MVQHHSRYCYICYVRLHNYHHQTPKPIRTLTCLISSNLVTPEPLTPKTITPKPLTPNHPSLLRPLAPSP